MHTVELLEAALTLAQELGYSVRQECLGGMGGTCEINGKKLLFVDLSMTVIDQLDQVVAALRAEGAELDDRFTLHFSQRIPVRPKVPRRRAA